MSLNLKRENILSERVINLYLIDLKHCKSGVDKLRKRATPKF
jgi:hypothetical protein